MIPIRLSVKNFLCYRENVPALDFNGLHLACLCGNNGHGKSALLDAITWCLWGKARGRTQDDLISYGADESRVELEFLSRDTHYRVIRSHARGGSRRRQGATDLQLQLAADGVAQPIGGNSVRETEAKIEHLVGMDYDTFINSAFLLQGRADEFTNKTPADRKAVLASILGLDVYDRLQVKARERLREVESSSKTVEGSLLQMRREIDETGDPTHELVGVGKYLSRLEQDLLEQRKVADEARSRVSELGQIRSELAQLQSRIQEYRQDAARLEATISSAQGRIQQYLAVIQRASEIEEGVQRLKEARQRFESLEKARSQFDTLTQEKRVLLQTIETRRVRLESQLEQLRHRMEIELSPKAQAEAALTQEREQIQRRLEELGLQERENARQRQHHQVLATSIGETQSTASRFEIEGREIRAKLEILQNTDHQEAACPLCGTPLGVDGCTRLADTYRTEIEDKRSQYREVQSKLKQLEGEKSALEKELPNREQALSRAQREADVRLREVERQIEESRQAQQELEQLKPQLAAVLTSLESREFAVAEYELIKALEQQIEALDYSEMARQNSLAEMRELQSFEERQFQLSQAMTRLPEEEESVTQARDMLQRRQQELSQQEGKYQAGTEVVTELPQWESQLRDAQQALADLESSQQSAISRRGYLEGQVRRLDQLRQQINDSTSRLTELEEERGIFQELAAAFGKQGVQAMLIETVVPRLEEEANLLLGRMTDNRMHVKLETQRERRTGRGGGDPIETLEINVSDELGPRSYEMYSGGEAFRVNLALRIALSKVLAQRMGAPLPTLFIDEGFGTQDAAGRERILDVIAAIQDDFDKIIVITHLDELKDMFPVRIEVHKDGNGSTFWLN